MVCTGVRSPAGHVTDTSSYTRIVLDPVPVRYGGDTPSLRRGSVRLNPVRDGGINPLAHQERILTRDCVGQKLRDVVDPQTGFCRGVSSAMFDSANNTPSGEWRPAVSGNVTRATEPAGFKLDTAGHYLLDCDGQPRVVRTEKMGDEPIPSALPCVDAKQSSKPGNGQSRAAKRPVSGSVPATRTRIPGATGPGGRITRADVEALIAVMARGKKVTITPAMYRDAKLHLIALREQARKALLASS